jgi:hypothetical protein
MKMSGFVGVGVVVLVLAGCSSDASESATPEVTATSNAEELSAWASQVCGTVDELAATVTGLTDGLDIDLSQGLDRLPALQEQVTANLDVVESDIEAVEDALAGVPEGSASATAFAAEMEALVDSARTSGQEAIDLLAEATAAGNLLGAGLAAAGAAAAAQSATSDANAALQLLDRTRQDAGGELGRAFSTAEGC